MEYRIPKKEEIYRHFKGNLYEIIIIARDSETLEEKVVYKEVNGDAAYVRSLPMFVSLVDREKYPDVTQEFRFELVRETISSPTVIEAEEEVENECSPEILEFLELDEVSEKIKYLQNVKDRITEEFIEVVAHSLDFVEKEGSLAERYTAVLKYLKTVERYERGRLR
ncbi:MAG: DUF1653 domain-containing protein [Tyzzerella sp.]|nr:DUF1653 domain-containing protein [Tyzzerella sp.]